MPNGASGPGFGGHPGLALLQGYAQHLQAQKEAEEEKRRQLIQQRLEQLRLRNAELSGREARQRIRERERESEERDTEIQAVMDEFDVGRGTAVAIVNGTLPDPREQEREEAEEDRAEARERRAEESARRAAASDRRSDASAARAAERHQVWREDEQIEEEVYELETTPSAFTVISDFVEQNPAASVPGMIPVWSEMFGVSDRAVNQFVNKVRGNAQDGLTSEVRQELDARSVQLAEQAIQRHGSAEAALNAIRTQNQDVESLDEIYLWSRILRNLQDIMEMGPPFDQPPTGGEVVTAPRTRR